MFHAFLAQATQPAVSTAAAAATQGQVDPPWWANQMFPIALGVLIFYFILIRPQRNKDKEKQKLLSALKRGDRVQTIGGVLGRVVEAHDNEVVVKVDESNNTKITFARTAIHRVLDEEKPAADK
jgi:preprotein translocase subunit YajC